MKNKLKTPLTLLLALATCMTFAACAGEISSTDASSDYNTSSNEEATLAERSTQAITTAPAEDPATNATVTDAPVTDAPVTNAPVTNEPATTPETKAPAKDTTKIPETEAPVEDTTKAPETESPVEDTTSPATTTKPEEETKAPATTAPGQDPNVDYSQWGKHGFENLLPIPLPFSDEEADWISKKDGSVNYKVSNNKKIRLDDPDDFPRIFKEYVESYEAYGYRVTLEQYEFAAQYKREKLFEFSCGDGYVIINIYIRS